MICQRGGMEYTRCLERLAARYASSTLVAGTIEKTCCNSNESFRLQKGVQMTQVKWQGEPLAPDQFEQFITYSPYRRSGELQYTKNVASIKRQMHSNRYATFAVYRLIPNTFNYELVFWLNEVPRIEEVPYDKLDNFIAELLS